MKTVIITGASSGIGKEFVRQLQNNPEYERIWIIARTKEKLLELEYKYGEKIVPIALDITDKQDVEKYKQLLNEEKPDVRLLVNNAGFGKFGSHEQIPVQESTKMIDLNCKAVVEFSELTLPYMNSGAKILQVASIAAFQPLPYINVYGATKAFVLNYAIGLDKELSHRNIRVYALCPGWTKTNFFAVAKTNPNDVKTFGVWFTPEQIVSYALKKINKTKKVILIPSLYNKIQCTLTKFVSRNFITKVWLKIQNKK